MEFSEVIQAFTEVRLRNDEAKKDRKIKKFRENLREEHIKLTKEHLESKKVIPQFKLKNEKKIMIYKS